ncbi:serine hydrolase domain-containing protein [Parenemella sanctibonifatiensis]|uniref:Beta-lactamase-related domain-containing protein n=1 Tax=Parenemella sanctibonifatiensis TaxID=2016505 RepID=A0A255EI62_9ACTN|nr:serine hydrolase domain-containing protein [Parenemella sanctibonifatiensis]OYN87823.1 hypothetical protein CGZ92_06030 [Parenemella sanctibonifatiensis]
MNQAANQSADATKKYLDFRGKWILTVVIALLVGAAAQFGFGPRASLDDTTTGDPDLIARSQDRLGSDAGYRALGVMEYDHGTTRYAGLGTSSTGAPIGPDDPIELGSVTKTFNGILLAREVDAGDLEWDQPVQELLPELSGTPAGEVTLEQLATHTSGLPPLLPSDVLEASTGVWTNDDVFGDRPVAEGLEEVKQVELAEQGTHVYSNLGASLLGHALTAHFGAPDWPTMVTEQFLEPLGMNATTFHLPGTELPERRVRPHQTNGHTAPEWDGYFYAPAGAHTWTTMADMSRYGEALMAGDVPGASESYEPRHEGDMVLGSAWMIAEAPTGTIQWHNGGTGGTRTFFALDINTSRVIFVVADTQRTTDVIGMGLLVGTPDAPRSTVADSPNPMAGVNTIGMVLALLVLVGGWVMAVRGRSWMSVVTTTVAAVTVSLLGLRFGPWEYATELGWGFLVAVAVMPVVAAVLRARSTGKALRRPILQSVELVLNVALLALAVWFL